MSIARSVTAPPDSRASTPQTSAADTPLTPFGVTGPISVSLKLGETGFAFSNGKWNAITPFADGPSPRDMVEAAELERLKKELDAVRAHADAVEQERNLLVFKNKLLTEMVRLVFRPPDSVADHSGLRCIETVAFFAVGRVSTGLQEEG